MIGNENTFIQRYVEVADRGDLCSENYIWLRDRLPKIVALLPKRPDNLGRMIKDEITVAGIAHRLFPDDPAVLGHLQSAGRMAGVAAQLLTPGTPASATLWLRERGLPPVKVPRTEAHGPSFHYGEAVQGFYAAFASREQAALDALSALPPDLLDDKRPGIEFAPTLSCSFGTMQALHLNQPSFTGELQAWLKATDPDWLPEWAIDLALYVDAPTIEMVIASTTGSTPDEFDRALTKALMCHKRFWATQDTISDLIALPALAFACRERDLGYRTAVRSDYLPMSVVDAFWPSSPSVS